MYHYAGNNPINYIDPDGRKSKYTNAYTSRQEVTCLAGDAQSVFEAQVIYEQAKNCGDIFINSLVLYNENFEIVGEYSNDQEIMDYFFSINPPLEFSYKDFADFLSIVSFSLNVVKYISFFVAPEFYPVINSALNWCIVGLDLATATLYRLDDNSSDKSIMASTANVVWDAVGLLTKIGPFNDAYMKLAGKTPESIRVTMENLVVPTSIFLYGLGEDKNE